MSLNIPRSPTPIGPLLIFTPNTGSRSISLRLTQISSNQVCMQESGKGSRTRGGSHVCLEDWVRAEVVGASPREVVLHCGVFERTSLGHNRFRGRGTLIQNENMQSFSKSTEWERRCSSQS